MIDKQSITKRLLVAVGLLVPVACQQGDLEVGRQIGTPSELEVQLVDSFTVQTATVLADTFVTSADSSVLIGQWADAQAGRTSARGFASVAYATNDLTDRSGTRFDSLVLVLPLSRAYGDTTELMTLNVHRLTRTLENKTYYNPDGAEYEAAPLLTKTIRPWPRYRTRQVRILLADDLGRSFFEQLRSRAIQDDESLASFLPGLAFGSSAPGGAGPNLLLGLNVSSGAAGLLLYYHDNDMNQTRSTIRFPLQGTHFSQMLTDLSQTSLRSLRSRADAVSSRQTQNMAFVNAVSRLRTRLQIPSLNELALLDQYRGVNRAELIVEPVRKDVRDNAVPPSQLTLYQTNDLNEVLAVVPDGQSNSSVSGYYSYDPTDLEQKGRYLFDVTYYINEVLKNRLTNRPLLLTAPVSDAQLPLERLAVGDAKNPAYRMRLKLYVTMEK